MSEAWVCRNRGTFLGHFGRQQAEVTRDENQCANESLAAGSQLLTFILQILRRLRNRLWKNSFLLLLKHLQLTKIINFSE